jgi:hypothetical protein
VGGRHDCGAGAGARALAGRASRPAPPLRAAAIGCGGSLRSAAQSRWRLFCGHGAIPRRLQGRQPRWHLRWQLRPLSRRLHERFAGAAPRPLGERRSPTGGRRGGGTAGFPAPRSCRGPGPLGGGAHGLASRRWRRLA